MQIQEDLERFTADAVYFDEHREELLEQYPEQWIAIYNKQVVGAAKDPKRLIKQLERRGIAPGHVFREYVSDKDDLLIVLSAPG